MWIFFSSKYRYIFPLFFLLTENQQCIVCLLHHLFSCFKCLFPSDSVFCRNGRNHLIIQRYTLTSIKCFPTYKIQPIIKYTGTTKWLFTYFVNIQNMQLQINYQILSHLQTQTIVIIIHNVYNKGVFCLDYINIKEVQTKSLLFTFLFTLCLSKVVVTNSHLI